MLFLGIKKLKVQKALIPGEILEIRLSESHVQVKEVALSFFF